MDTKEDYEDGNESIAIVGLAGRFPGAIDVDQYWRNLLDGKIESTTFSTEELLDAGVNSSFINDENFVRSAPVLENADRFDAEFFGYSPYEAQLIDPQQRQLLEIAWLAMENSGYDPSRFDGRIATFAGTAMNTYMLHTGLANQFFKDYLPVLLGSDKDYIATRIAYKLGLNGPAVTVQTACSTSLVAIHMARQCLLEQEADMALVGAATVRCPLKTGHLYQEGSVFSPDGACRPFDATAAGTVFGSGVGALVLRRLTDAESDGDTIHAIIRGSAINNDGDTKNDFTAPTVIKQAEVVVEAMDAAEVDAETIGYVEAHGTGTYVGDPIEIEALTRAYKLDTESTGFCGLGSVKGNIGHLDAAAGMASLIKVVQSLKHGVLPASGNYQTPNPQIDFLTTPFYVLKETTEWSRLEGHPRRAGVSSLGMGGTNSHVVLEEYIPQEKTIHVNNVDNSGKEQPLVIPLSAANSVSLKKRMSDLAAYLKENSFIEFADVAFTLQHGRRDLRHRAAVIACNASEAIKALESGKPPAVSRGEVKNTSNTKCPVLLMFPGQGSQYPGMGAKLYESEPVFRKCVDVAEKILVPEFNISIVDLICNPSREDINETYLTQPALYVSSYAYAQLLQSWGIIPDRLLGHSIGEIVAATCSSVISYDDGVRLVAHRGRLMHEAPGGSMLMVPMSAESVQNNLAPNIEIAVINSTETCVVAGPDKAIEAAKLYYAESGIDCRILKTSHAFHTSMMDRAVLEFGKVVRGFNLSIPKIPFASCVSGDWITDEEAVSPEYWALQIRSTVLFSDVLKSAFRIDRGRFIECGPGIVLSQAASSHASRKEHHTVLSVGKHPKMDACARSIAYGVIGNMWVAGDTIDWTQSQKESGGRIPVPCYPFDGKSHWFESDTDAVVRGRGGIKVPTEPSSWVWRENWSYVRDDGVFNKEYSRLFVLDPDEKLPTLQKKIELNGINTLRFLDPQELIHALAEQSVDSSVHLVYVPAEYSISMSSADLIRVYDESFSLLRDIVDSTDSDLTVTVIHFNSLPTLGSKCNAVNGSIMAGMLPVFEAEYPNLTSQYIDISDEENYLDSLVTRLLAPGNQRVLSFKEGRWWARTYESQPFGSTTLELEDKSVCHIIVGAFGGIGRKLVSHLISKSSTGKIVLVGRLNAEREEYLRSLSEYSLDVAALDVDITEEVCREKILSSISGSYNSGFIFNLAGTTADGLIRQKNVNDSRDVLISKVNVTKNLLAVAIKADMDLVLFSSVAAISGPVGQVDYAAANSFQMSVGHMDRRVIAIAWPGWKNTGMLSRLTDEQARKKHESFAVDAKTGFEILDLLISGNRQIGPVVVSAIAPNDFIDRTLSLESDESSDDNNDPIVGLDNAEAIIGHELSKSLKIDDFDPDDNIFNLGGSSLMVVTLLSTLKAKYGVSIALNDAIANPLFSDWVRLYEEASERKVVEKTNVAVQLSDLDYGPVPPVTSISRYVDRRAGVNFNQWNLAVMLECQERFDKQLMEGSLRTLLNHHDMLRARIDVRKSGRYSIRVREPVDSANIETIDCSSVDDDSLSSWIEGRAADLQQNLDLSSTILFQIVHFYCGNGRPDRLLLFVHHFVADGLSWTIILSDLQQLYSSQMSDGKICELSEKTTSYVNWSELNFASTLSDEFVFSSKYWGKLPWEQCGRVPLDRGDIRDNVNSSGCDIQTILNEEVSSRLTELTKVRNLPIDEFLISAFARAIALWAQWSDDQLVLLDVMGHGRSITDEWDVSRTVGFFNSYAPVLVNPHVGKSARSVVGILGEKVREMLKRGNEHDLAKYICKHESVISEMERVVPAEVLFNYIGNLKESNDRLLDPVLFKVARESHGATHGKESKRDHILAMRVEQEEARFKITLVYSTNLHEESNIQKLLDSYVEQITEISNHR